MRSVLYSVGCLLFMAACSPVKNKPMSSLAASEPHRPLIHFTPKEKWMNDPNGMVYYKGTYHLFYQYYPGGTKWGPMHWGHATSKDLMHWTHQPIALYPDPLGYIFSGSAVVDKNNTSGFGKEGQVPLVAIFTHHDTTGISAGRKDYQNQSLAYSLDEGKTWTKYAGNPVLRNPGIIDFRDPKVMWYEPQKKWVMTLATKDRITFYSSPDLKTWTKESEFGADLGAHGGVWECPDLFTLDHNGKSIWVLIVNLNPGGPNGGSATQYFIGDFNGKTFTAAHRDTRWLDYGPDEYAGVTWSNTGERRIFLGWMSNWLYGEAVPTEKWRSAMTIPRDLSLKTSGSEYYVASRPSKELEKIESNAVTVPDVGTLQSIDLSTKVKDLHIPCRLDLSLKKAADFSIIISNDQREEVVIGFDQERSQYFMDRSRSGKVDFHKDFGRRFTAPRIAKKDALDITLVIDVSSAELFADEGLSVMTSIFFPNKPFNKIRIQSNSTLSIDKLNYATLKSTLK